VTGELRHARSMKDTVHLGTSSGVSSPGDARNTAAGEEEGLAMRTGVAESARPLVDSATGRTDSMATVIDSTAVVDSGAELGAGVQVGPYAIIGKNAVIGNRCTIGPHAVIDGWTLIGDDCHIHASAVVGSEPQDLKFDGARSFVEIGQGNVIREFVTINRATEEDGVTRIGDGNLLMAYVHVAHNCVLGDHVILANAVNLAGHVEIDDYAIIGGVTPIHQFVRIGRHAFIGGGSRVPQDVPPYIRCAGNPPRVGGLNSVGLKRRNFPDRVVTELKRAYRLVYRSDLNVTQALARMRAELDPLPEVEEFVEFIAASERGIVK
jgi:UDP-N-acetylglucosamine acyltransferase